MPTENIAAIILSAIGIVGVGVALERQGVLARGSLLAVAMVVSAIVAFLLAS